MNKPRVDIFYDDYNNFMAGACLIQIVIAIVTAILCGVSTDYLLDYFFAANIPFIFDVVLGLVVGGLTIPIAVVVWILAQFGII